MWLHRSGESIFHQSTFVPPDRPHFERLEGGDNGCNVKCGSVGGALLSSKCVDHVLFS